MPVHPVHPGRLPRVLLATALAVGLTTAVVSPATAQTPARLPAPGEIAVYPEPGSTAASPGTEISLRGGSAGDVGDVVVTGDRTGPATGELVEHGDGDGVSFVPDSQFAEGEQVTVTTTSGVESTFTVADAGPAQPTRAQQETAGDSSVQAQATAPPQGLQTFLTRPDLAPTNVAITENTGAQRDGYVMTAPRVPGAVSGPTILDDEGEVVWFHPSDAPFIADFKVVRYLGQDALTWYEGEFTVRQGVSAGEYVLVDRAYNEIARVRAGNGYEADLHDIELTPDGTALVLAYAPVSFDLRPYGGSADGVVLDQVVQEIEVSTGRVLFEWHSLDHVPVDQTTVPVPTDPGDTWDYIHGNSVELDTDGNILLSGRSSSAVYKIDRRTGELVWTLGKMAQDWVENGKFFTVVPKAGQDEDDVWFASQHDARRRADGTFSVLDNGGGSGLALRDYTRGLVLALDETAMTVTLVKEVRRTPNDIFSQSQANYQELAGGHDLIGWGSHPTATEFDATGTPVWEVRYPDRVQSYRAFRQEWTGVPTQPPTTAVQESGPDAYDVHVSWNGATEVAGWEVLTGPTPSELEVTASSARSGFETVVPVSTADPLYSVRAKNAAGEVIGTSAVGVLGPFFTEQEFGAGGGYAIATGDFGGGEEDDVLYYGHGPAGDYVAISDGKGGLSAPFRLPAIGGAHQMKVGNFVGGKRDEVLFWSPRSNRAWMWRFDGTSPQQTGMAVPVVEQAIVLDHVPDRTGSAHDEVLWASEAAGGDSVDHFRWPLGGRLTRTWILADTQRRFQPLVGDFDGNGWADVFWYAPGAATDYVWYFEGDRTTGTTGYTWTRERVDGPFTPLTGDFTGDNVDDLLWYRSGPALDYVWAGAGIGQWEQSASAAGGSGVPTVLRSSPDYVALQNPDDDLRIWYPVDDVLARAGNRAVPSGYTAVAGAFTSLGADGLYLYKAGSRPRTYLPVLP